MLKENTYETPNAIDPGEAPPSRPSHRKKPASSIADNDVRRNAERLLKASTGISPPRSPTSDKSLSVYDAEDNRSLQSDEESHGPFHSLPNVEEARMYAGRILNANSVRDLSPESAERARLTSSDNSQSMRFRSTPLLAPSDIQPTRRQLMKRVLLLFSAVAIVVVIVGLSVVVGQTSKRSNSNNSNVNQQQPEGGQPSLDTSSTGGAGNNDETKTEGSVSRRFTDLMDFIVRNNISNEEELRRAGSAQYQAVTWMANQDQMSNSYPVPPTTTDIMYASFVQRYVLAVLYFNTNGPFWESQNKFLDNEHECGWAKRVDLSDGEEVAVGVSCDNNMHVSELLMPRNNMAGRLPAEMGHLTSLTFVDFNRNELTGTIPDELASCTAMDFFDMRYNQLTGSIPNWIGNSWPLLVELALSDNEMTGSLPESIASLLALKSLALANNHITSSLVPISTLGSLEFLYLENNSFMDTVDSSFLQNMNNLIQVDISSNSLTGTDLPLQLFTHPKIQVLDLGDNNIMGTFPANLELNSALQYLALNDNVLTGSIPASISQLEALHHFDVTGNDLTGPIPQEFAELRRLTYLFLSENGFDQGPFPVWISEMHELRELSLSNTQRNGSIPAEWIAFMDNLVLLDLSYNAMTGEIPSELWTLPNLKFLLLNRNQFSGSLPPGSSHTKLNLFLLDKNALVGDLSEICVSTEMVDPIMIVDCDEIICECCKCCADHELRCNDDILYSNLDFSFENNYTRTSYAFSPDILFEDS